MATAKKEEYTADTIVSLDQHTHLLKRLSLTFGAEAGNSKSPYSTQKGVSIREILDNALDEVRGGHGTHVRLSFFADGSIEVKDSGRGLPVDTSKLSDGKKVSGVYKCLGIIQSGGKFTADSDRFSSGLNGVGASSTIHTSKRADVSVFRGGKKYELSFKDGVPGFFSGEGPDADFTELDDYSKLKVSKDARPAAEKKDYPTGTTVRVWLRDEVFQSEYQLDHQDIIARLRGTAFLVPQLYAEVYNELDLLEDPEKGTTVPQEELFHFEEGVLDLIRLHQPDSPLTPIMHFVTEGKYTERNVPVLQPNGKVVSQDLDRRVPIEVALSYGSGYAHSMHSFCNTIHTKLGGVHEIALERAMQKAFSTKFRSMRGLLSKKDEDPLPEDFQEGLTVVLSVQVAEPQFTSQSKEQLSGRDLQKAVLEALTAEFEKWIASPKNADVLQTISKKVVTASRNRQKAREQRDMNRKKNELSSASLPVKLVDCNLAGTEDAELYIVEGDSAAASMKAARDGERHALLGVRGKVFNIHKGGVKDALKNAEVQDLIKALAADIGADFDLDKMRYGRIFIAVDADPDGNSIACQLYALFWHLFRDVITQGRLFKVETPLFVFSTNQGAKSRKYYARDDRERDKVKAKLDKSKVKYSITRLKGLGEMNAEDLHIAAMNADTRVVTQITVEDAAAAEESLELILGNDSGPRKMWIEQYAPAVDEELID